MNITIKKTENNYDINITFNEALLSSNVSIGNLQDLITSILKEIEHDRFFLKHQ